MLFDESLFKRAGSRDQSEDVLENLIKILDILGDFSRISFNISKIQELPMPLKIL